MGKPKTEQIRVRFPGGVNIWTAVVSREGPTLVVRLIRDYPDWAPQVGDRVAVNREGDFEIVAVNGPELECTRLVADAPPADSEVTTA